jgi:glutamate-5-semialdehyde dehydrogenase
VGELTGGWRRPNGLEVRRIRTPLGVIGVIYEARPNVTVDAAVLCLKAGNAVILRGSAEARNTNAILLAQVRRALAEVGLPADAAQAPESTTHEAIEALVSIPGGLDVVIPRGGPALIDAVNRAARVPVIQHYQGVCHVFVEATADLATAVEVVINAKVQRPGVCNAMEALLVDAAIADEALPTLVAALRCHGVELRACERARAVVPDLAPARPEDYGREFLDLVALVCVVDGIEGALAHIRRYGSNHTEAILTRDLGAANRFAREVDASCVVINASTRFNDGGCLGLGAEIGISTSRLHCYGPMGLTALTTERFVVHGDGQVRT